ncbi:MAG: hypothetical protein JNM21_08050 [Taibaiella sp.]|nr:hypothetical protein [Taibaiella sp.]
MKRLMNLLLPGLLFLFSCDGVQEFSAAELDAYAGSEASGWVQRKSYNGINYVIKYRPVSLIALHEEESDSARAKRQEALKKMYRFNIDIQVEGSGQSPLRHGISGLEEYNARLDYFLNQASKDIWLIDGNDTLRPAAYWFENNHNLTSHETIVLNFDNTQIKNKEIQLAFNDRLFRNGIIKASFQKNDLDKKIALTYDK